MDLSRCGTKTKNINSSFAEYNEYYMLGEKKKLQLRITAQEGGFEHDQNNFLHQYFGMICNFLKLSFIIDHIYLLAIETLGDLFAIIKNYKSALIYYMHAVF